MKFTKEEVYEELVKEMTKNGEKLNITSRTLYPTLETLMKYAANDETELADFVKLALPSAKAMDGQYRKEHSDFIKEWNESHPTDNHVDDKKKGDDKKDVKKEENPELADILAKLNALQERVAEDDKKKAISNKRSELVAAMEKKGIKDKNWTKDFLDEINITEDMDVDSKADSFLKIYNKSKASEGSDITPLGSSKGGNKNKDLYADINKEAEKRREREKQTF